MNNADLLKAFDPRKILEAYSGDLGTDFGVIFGAFGDYAEFKPESYFKMNDFFNANDYFDPKTLIRAAVPDFGE